MVFLEGKSALWAPLGGPTPQWVPLALPPAPAGVSALSGTLGCLASDVGHKMAIALSTAAGGSQIGVARLRDDGIKPVVEWLTSTQPPPARREVACALNNAGQLVVLGGYLPGSDSAPALDIATFDGALAGATKLSWQPVAAPDAAATARVGATLLPTSKGLAVVGGYTQWTESGLQRRRSSHDTLLLASGPSATTPLDVARPRARVGAAVGYWNGHGACLVGGVAFELPNVGSGPARVEPVTDAWCLSDVGAWSLRATGLPPWAFGIGGTSENAKRTAQRLATSPRRQVSRRATRPSGQPPPRTTPSPASVAPSSGHHGLCVASALDPRRARPKGCAGHVLGAAAAGVRPQ